MISSMRRLSPSRLWNQGCEHQLVETRNTRWWANGEAHRLEKRGCFLFIFKELSTLGWCKFPALALICTCGFVLFWIWCCLVVWRSGVWLGFECPSQAHSESKIGSGICKFSSMDVCSEEHMHSRLLYSTHSSVSRMIKQWLKFSEIWSDGSMLEGIVVWRSRGGLGFEVPSSSIEWIQIGFGICKLTLWMFILRKFRDVMLPAGLLYFGLDFHVVCSCCWSLSFSLSGEEEALNPR